MSEDKQTDDQPALQPPDRIWIKFARFRSRSILVGESMYTRESDSDIEYARVVDGVVATVDHDRLAAIRARWQENKKAFETWKARDIIPDSLPMPSAFADVDYLFEVVDAATNPIAAPVEGDNERDDDNV